MSGDSDEKVKPCRDKTFCVILNQRLCQRVNANDIFPRFIMTNCYCGAVFLSLQQNNAHRGNPTPSATLIKTSRESRPCAGQCCNDCMQRQLWCGQVKLTVVIIVHVHLSVGARLRTLKFVSAHSSEAVWTESHLAVTHPSTKRDRWFLTSVNDPRVAMASLYINSTHLSHVNFAYTTLRTKPIVSCSSSIAVNRLSSLLVKLLRSKNATVLY